jgi:hypothetical protein
MADWVGLYFPVHNWIFQRMLLSYILQSFAFKLCMSYSTIAKRNCISWSGGWFKRSNPRLHHHQNGRRKNRNCTSNLWHPFLCTGPKYPPWMVRHEVSAIKQSTTTLSGPGICLKVGEYFLSRFHQHSTRSEFKFAKVRFCD